VCAEAVRRGDAQPVRGDATGGAELAERARGRAPPDDPQPAPAPTVLRRSVRPAVSPTTTPKAFGGVPPVVAATR
jgi:hypothetical protein